MAMQTLSADVRPAKITRTTTVEQTTSALEFTLRADVEALIAKAQEVLSSRMYAAFLRWGEAAITANTRFDDDDDAAAERTSRCSRELKHIGATDAGNVHDVMFKAYLLALEAADAPAFGPLGIDPAMASGYNLEGLVAGLNDDLTVFSPICQMINDWAARAWAMSNASAALTPQFAATMLAPFQQVQNAAPPTAPAGYDPYMRGPLIQWQKAYAVYEQTDAELSAFDRDVHTPAADKWTALSKRAEAGDADTSLPAALEDARVALDVAQDGYDALVSARGDAIDTLLTLPAPSASELAIKLRLYRDAYTWGGGGAERNAIEAMVIDGRRFGRQGAHLQTDEALLAAFADRRREFEATYDNDMSQEEEDGYFSRLDAYEGVISATPATTIEGVMIKLRIGFMHQNGSAWADRVIMDPAHPDFVAGLGQSDMYTRLAWSAIEDLARIGGISLAEQGR